jgi:hypothetical protein
MTPSMARSSAVAIAAFTYSRVCDFTLAAISRPRPSPAISSTFDKDLPAASHRRSRELAPNRPRPRTPRSPHRGKGFDGLRAGSALPRVYGRVAIPETRIAPRSRSRSKPLSRSLRARRSRRATYRTCAECNLQIVTNSFKGGTEPNGPNLTLGTYSEGPFRASESVIRPRGPRRPRCADSGRSRGRDRTAGIDPESH